MKHFKQILLTVLVALVSSVTANAYDFEVDGIYCNVLSREDLTCEITYKSSNGYSYFGDFVIPASVSYSGRTFIVSKIGDDAFRDCTDLASITIPNSVTTIGRNAFSFCHALSSVTIPNSVTTLEDGAFSQCFGLTSVTIPNSVTYIGNNTFWDCGSLTSVTIANSVITIGQRAFESCIGLSSITIPNSVTIIDHNTFNGCRGLISVTIDNSVTTIKSGAFQDCCNIKEITSLNVTPPETDANAFQGISKIDCIVKVPARALSAYQSADGWKEFWCFEAISSDGSENILYEGTADEIIEESDLAAAAGIIEKSTAANALVLSNTEISNVSDIPAANIAAINKDGNYVAKKIVLTDAEPFYCPTDVTAEQITYTRNFEVDAWQALYLPFAMSYEDWKDKAEVAYINNVHQWDDDDDGEIERTVLEFITKKSGIIEPNKPYVIKPKQTGEVTFTTENTTLYATPATDGYVDCRSTTTEYTLYGTYQTKTDMCSGGYYAMWNGNFMSAESDAVTLAPFRTYLKIESRNGAGTVNKAKRISIMVDGVVENDVTGIMPVTVGNNDAAAFNLAGQKVGNGYKGIVVKNGKKYINK